MKQVVTIIDRENNNITIFTSHITYIQHAQEGCIIHIGAENKPIYTLYKWQELVNVLALK